MTGHQDITMRAGAAAPALRGGALGDVSVPAGAGTRVGAPGYPPADVVDVEALRAENARLRALAYRDRLTGLRNRAWLEDHWPSRGLVLVCDLNGFKAINDTHGHAAGDVVLQVVAARLAMMQRTAVARLGGDEFAVLAGGEPELVAERVAVLVALPVRLAPGHGWARVTAAIGWTEIADGEPIESALHRADLQMYRHKHGTGHGAVPGQVRRRIRDAVPAVAA